MSEDLATLDVVDDPAAMALARERERELNEQAKRNDTWPQAHWAEILPRARGKFLAVAGQEAFIADTYEEAHALAKAAHPEDGGLLCQGVPSDQKLTDNLLTIQPGDDPIVAVSVRARRERFKRNLDWLQTHWDDLSPRARGKYVVVAEREAFVADASEEAWAMARAAHPEDDGAFCHYLTTKRGPRIYAHRG